jgi:hypothetical protein
MQLGALAPLGATVPRAPAALGARLQHPRVEDRRRVNLWLKVHHPMTAKLHRPVTANVHQAVLARSGE